jgi:hypothetical protein
MIEHKKLSKEEKKKAIAEYKANKKAELAKERAEENAKIQATKNLSKEEKNALAKQKKEDAAKQKKDYAEKTAKEKAEKKEKKAQEKALLQDMNKEEREVYKKEKKAKEDAYVASAFAEYKKKHDEAVEKKRDELNARYDFWGNIHRFFFNLGQSKFCQGYMNWWKKCSIRHPWGSHLIYQLFYFIVFSEGVTIVQLLIMLFLPYAFGLSLAQTPFVWPAVPLGLYDTNGSELFFAIFNEPVIDANNNQIAATGDLSQGVIGGGLGNFIAFEIAVFLAQCINFPLQRNITYKSHGNPYWQAMWYFIGWVAISLFVNAVWGIVNPLLIYWQWNAAIKSLLKTFITGGLSMVIFFFIFKIIFPAGEATQQKE